MARLNIYLVTMRSGEIRTIVAAREDQARKRASQDATDEGLEFLEKGNEETGRALMADTVAGVSLYRKAGGSQPQDSDEQITNPAYDAYWD